MYRWLYESRAALIKIFTNNPATACVLFGLPLSLFIILCYSTCCMNIMDANEDDDDDDNNDGMFK